VCRSERKHPCCALRVKLRIRHSRPKKTYARLTLPERDLRPFDLEAEIKRNHISFYEGNDCGRRQLHHGHWILPVACF
jgi:hypothetical protein